MQHINKTLVIAMLYFQIILVTIDSLSVEDGPDCGSDYIEFTSGAIVWDHFCSSSTNTLGILISSTAVNTSFQTNDGLTSNGFSASFESIDPVGMFTRYVESDMLSVHNIRYR